MPKEVNQHRTMLHEHMASYQVSVSNSLESPLASGTFVKFTTVVEGNPTKVFGILTAKHVLDNDDGRKGYWKTIYCFSKANK